MSLEDLTMQDMWGERKCRLKPRNIPRELIADLKGLEKFYSFGLLLGYGRFGEVYQAIERKTGEKFAIKISKRQNGEARVETKVMDRELSILSFCKHPNIVELLKTFVTPEYTYMVLEYCNSSLADLLQTHFSSFKETELASMVRQVVSALTYLHSNEIAHRDIKLPNLLFNPGSTKTCDVFGVVKISDFGLAACRGAKGTPRMFSCCCGTPIYMAPEVLSRNSYDQKCDVWSLGVVLYLCIVRQAPFPGSSEVEVKERIDSSRVSLKGGIWETFSMDCVLALKKMLQVNPKRRYSSEELGESAWIKGNGLTIPSSPPEVSETKILAKDLPYHSSMRTRCTNPSVYKAVIVSNKDSSRKR